MNMTKAGSIIPRERYMAIIRDYIDTPVIKALTGMRRSGKSFLLMLLKDELSRRGTSSENILYLNFESMQCEHLKEYHALYTEVSKRVESVDGRLYILLDEIQEVTGWEKAVNSFRVDFDCDIFITGSNADLLSGELATLLSGRYVKIPIYPLDFKEYLDFAKHNLDESKLTLQEHFKNFLHFGGLPGIHDVKWDANRINLYLYNIFDTIIFEDIISRNNIRDTDLLRRVVSYVMDNIGNTFSAKTISDFLKNQGRNLSSETVYNYLQMLEDAFLIHKVSRYDIKGKKILETQEKYYLSDLGLRHAVMGYRDNDIAGILENAVYLELLRRGYTVHIGRQSGAEVDFVADKNDDRLYVQVTYILTEDNMDREFAPLEAIEDNYNKIIISTDSLFNVSRGGIRQQNIIDFMMSE